MEPVQLVGMVLTETVLPTVSVTPPTAEPAVSPTPPMKAEQWLVVRTICDGGAGGIQSYFDPSSVHQTC